MSVTKGQARELLHEVDEVTKNIQDRVAYSIVGPILVLWGVIWTACHMIGQFAPRQASPSWLIGDAVGIAGTIYFGWIKPRRGPVLSKSSKREGRRLFWFWFLLFIYGDIWLALLWPWRGEQLGIFVTTLVMFAFVVMGLWLELWFLLGVGLTVTVLAGAGYVLSFVVPGYIDLWMAVSGGGALLGSGLFLMRRWRVRHV